MTKMGNFLETKMSLPLPLIKSEENRILFLREKKVGGGGRVPKESAWERGWGRESKKNIEQSDLSVITT